MKDQLSYEPNEQSETPTERSGFRVPDGYFDNLKNAILSQTTGQVTQGDPATDQYFEDLKGRILSKTTQAVPKRTYRMQVIVASPVFRFAAAAVFVAALTLVLRPGAGPEQATALRPEFSNEEVIHYLELNDPTDLPVADIAAQLPETSSITKEEKEWLHQTEEELIIDAL